jgi:Sulfatase
LFNAHTVENYNSPHVKGFTGSDFLLDPHTYEYLNASFQRDYDPPVSHEGEYSTDLVAKKAYGFLDDAVEAKKPFFITVAPNAPHSNVKFLKTMVNGSFESNSLEVSPPVPAERHAHLFEDVVIPRTLNFNPDKVCSGSGSAFLVVAVLIGS